MFLGINYRGTKEWKQSTSKAIIIIQVELSVALSSSGGGEPQLYSKHILNEELTGLLNRFDLEDERKKGIKNDSRILA